MDFGLSEEQCVLEETLRRYLLEAAPPARVREIAASESAHDPTLWAGLAELGALGILVPEEHGGSGLAMLDAVVAATVLGSAVAPVPFLASAVMAPVALTEAGTPAQRAEWLPALAGGKRCLGVAATELVTRYEGAGVERDGMTLRGRALFALDGGAADAFLVAVGRDGLALVEGDARGLERETLSSVDRTRRLTALELDGTPVLDWIGGEDGAARANARMLDAGRIALAADLLGASERCIELAVDYAKQRVQFGRVIGSFQAVKHLCAEMAAELEPSRSLVWYAAHAFDASGEEASRMALHAKAQLSEVGTFIARTATEVHGGIGFTEDHDLHLWFKRIGVDRQLLGGPETLRARAAEVEGWVSPA